jgi:NAD kinase
MSDCDKLVVVTRKTALEELVERFNTREQARFYIEHMGGSFASYQDAHDAFQGARDRLKAALPRGIRGQWVDRAFLPTFTFGARDLVVTLGPDGLVVNTAKYLAGQPLLALNPDPARVDGVLIPFSVAGAATALRMALEGELGEKRVTMALAELNDGQRLYALNDLFVGQETHVSARYRIRHGGGEEDQSSSGIIVSTGAGSTGWLRSVLTGASAVMRAYADSEAVRAARDQYRFDWEAEHLVFAVREPFVSKISGADLVIGKVSRTEPLEVVSNMPQNGVIFSDGVEEDNLAFNSGLTARIAPADKALRLLVPPGFGDDKSW